MSQEAPNELNEAEIEGLFSGIIAALCVAVKLDEIRLASGERDCLIRSHDSYGPLPDIKAPLAADKKTNLDRISISIARLGMVARFRKELAELYCGCSFLLPIYRRKATLVGFKTGDKTILAKGPDPCRAYQELKKAADTSLKTP